MVGEVSRLALVAAAAALALVAGDVTTAPGAVSARTAPLCRGSGPTGTEAAIYRTPLGCIRLSDRIWFNNPASGHGHRALVVRRSGRTIYWSHVPWRVGFKFAEVECRGGTFRVRFPFVYRSIQWCYASDPDPESRVGGGIVHGVFKLVVANGEIRGVRKVSVTVD